jgi:hypothetical protein
MRRFDSDPRLQSCIVRSAPSDLDPVPKERSQGVSHSTTSHPKLREAVRCFWGLVEAADSSSNRQPERKTANALSSKTRRRRISLKLRGLSESKQNFDVSVSQHREGG